MNIIGDVAGRFNELMLLVDKMPDDDFLFVGDLNDRGAQTPEVIDWVMENAKCVQSNHGDMFVDYANKTRLYGNDIFVWNGGQQTLNSYVGKDDKLIEHVKWLEQLPFFYEDDELFVSHAAIHKYENKEFFLNKGPEDDSILWNRGYPKEIKGKLQILGHNSHWGLKYFGEKSNPWAVCIDQSGDGILTGINTNSLEIFTEEYTP